MSYQFEDVDEKKNTDNNETWRHTHCDHTKDDFQMSFIGHIYLSGGNLHENFQECYICVKCGRVYLGKEFDKVPDGKSTS